MVNSGDWTISSARKGSAKDCCSTNATCDWSTPTEVSPVKYYQVSQTTLERTKLLLSIRIKKKIGSAPTLAFPRKPSSSQTEPLQYTGTLGVGVGGIKAAATESYRR